MAQFYTYLHCKPDGTPFYVGKGSGKRSNFMYDRNPHHQIKKKSEATKLLWDDPAYREKVISAIRKSRGISC
jgi:hypothetical protein